MYKYKATHKYAYMLHMWMRDVTHVNVMSLIHMCDMCGLVYVNRIFLRDVIMRDVTQTTEPHHSFEWGMSHVWMSCHSFTQQGIQACHTCEWGMSLMRMRHVTRVTHLTSHAAHVTHVTHHAAHVTRVNEACHAYEWVMSQAIKEQGIESCHTYEWVMPHMWMSHVTHVNEPCHTCE